MSRSRAVTGKVIAITGGARGIGRAIAERLTTAGARVAIGDRDLEAAQETAAELGVRAYSLDVADRDSFDDFLGAVRSELGPVDVLINNAGIMWVGSFE